MYDIAKIEEGNFCIKKTFVNYCLPQKKNKKIYQKSKNVEHQLQHTRNKKINKNSHSFKDENLPKFIKWPFGNKYNKKNNFQRKINHFVSKILTPRMEANVLGTIAKDFHTKESINMHLRKHFQKRRRILVRDVGIVMELTILINFP